MKQKILVLNIALNGYQWMYKKELSTHKKYADKHGYTHQSITSPVISPLGVECCWLKLTLMRSAILSGYHKVLFLDADTTVKPNCPALSEITAKDKYVYMAKGYSDRFNSGVILVINNEHTVEWLNKVINSRENEVQDLNDVGWGENGHVIEHSIGNPFIKELDEKWNNTSNYKLNDYIRHSNCGPMRTSKLDNLFHKIVFYISAKYLTYIKNKTTNRANRPYKSLLFRETNKILSLYPSVTTP